MKFLGNVLFRRGVSVLAAIVSVAAMLAMAGAYARVAQAIGWWAYLLTMGIYMTASGITLEFVVPPKHKRALLVPRLRDRLASYERRFENGNWQKVRKRGGFTFILAATVILSPVIGALVARTLGLSEEKVWRHVFGTNLIASALWSSVYIGVGNVFAALF